jgi:hypothetical protein
MLASLIRWSIQNRFLVLMATGLLARGLMRPSRRHSMHYRTSRTRRSSSAPNFPGRRHRW